MFLSDKAQLLIDGLRGKDGDVFSYKSAVSDAMSIILLMRESHANTGKEKDALIDALNVLADYNELLTELSKEK